MKMGQLLMGVALAGAFLLYLPDMIRSSGTAAEKPADGANVAHEPRGEFGMAEMQRELSSDQAVIQRAADGHFYAYPMISGQEYRFMVDTGASMVALTAADAMDMGFQWNDEDVVPIGRGANGTVEGVPVRIEQMELAGVTVREVEAAIIPDGLDTSLLGQSFLSQIENMQVSRDSMTLGS